MLLRYKRRSQTLFPFSRKFYKGFAMIYGIFSEKKHKGRKKSNDALTFKMQSL